MPLFPENYILPILTSDQIRAKITGLHLTDYDVPKILDHIAVTIQKAMSTSIDAQQYISFVLNHPLCNIVARPRRPFSDHTVYNEQFMMVFQIDDQFIENLNVKEVLNDFWHSFFYFYLHNTYTNFLKALPECTSSSSGFSGANSPFTPATEATLQNDRSLITAIYNELSFLIYRLEIALKERKTNPLYPLNAID